MGGRGGTELASETPATLSKVPAVQRSRVPNFPPFSRPTFLRVHLDLGMSGREGGPTVNPRLHCFIVGIRAVISALVAKFWHG